MNLNLTKKVAAAIGGAAVASGLVACADNITGPLRSAEGTSAQLAVSSAADSAPIRRVTGGGRLVLPGVDVEVKLTAQLLPDGTARGSYTNNAHDMSAFGLPGHNMIQNEIDCLEFDGNVVWFGGPMKQTTMPGTHPAVIGMIIDSEAGDRLFSGPVTFAAPGKTCHDRPVFPFPPNLIDGDFKVE